MRRFSTFWYDEAAGPLNGNVQRLLKVSYTYSADSKVATRTATVATNNGPDVAITSDEIDQWLNNYEKGVSPAGPPVNLLGWVRGVQTSSTMDIDPVCALCYLSAAEPTAMRLYYSGIDRGTNDAVSAPTTHQLSSPKSLVGATKCTDGCAEEREACTATCARAQGDFNQPCVWTGKWKTCMRSACSRVAEDSKCEMILN